MTNELVAVDGTPSWCYDEDGYCVVCHNGFWKYHMPECQLRDLLDAAIEAGLPIPPS